MSSVGEELVAIADSICPYSNATRGNIPVKLVLEKPSPTSESQAVTDVMNPGIECRGLEQGSRCFKPET